MSLSKFDWQVLEVLSAFEDRSPAYAIDILYTGQEVFEYEWSYHIKNSASGITAPHISLSLGKLRKAGLAEKAGKGWRLTEEGLKTVRGIG